MSGGSMNYVCWTLADCATGRMMDRELEEMLKDFVDLLHDCEWVHSCDTSDEKYFETVRKFKNKWFGKRDERLKEIVEKSVGELKEELMRMIGEEGNEQ